MLKLFVLLVGGLLTMPASAAEVERLRGEGTLVRGLVRAPLAQGVALRDGDEVQVGPASEVLVRISEKIAFLLRSGSSMTVANASDDLGVALRLISGALRYVSGSRISHKFRTSTPHASMGVRGTDFEVVVLNEGVPGGLAAGTYVTVRHGAVDVTDASTGTTATVTQDQSVHARVAGPDPNATVAQAQVPDNSNQRPAPRTRALTRPLARVPGTGGPAREQLSEGLWRIELLPAARGEFDEVLDGLR